HVSDHILCSYLPPLPPTSPLFPYTTLFRSRVGALGDPHHHAVRLVNHVPRRRGRERAQRFPTAPADAGSARDVDDDMAGAVGKRSEEHTSELQSLRHLVCRLLLEKKKKNQH